MPDFCEGLVSESDDDDDADAALADGSSDLLTSFLAFLCDVLMPCEAGGDGESVMEEEEEEVEKVTGML